MFAERRISHSAIASTPHKPSALSGGRDRSRLGVSEASSMFGVTPRALRFYEERGLIEVPRDRHGSRVYGSTVRNRLRWIIELRRAHLGLDVICEILAEPGRFARATAHRALLLQQKEAVARLAAVNKALEDVAALPELEPIDGGAR